MVYPSLLNLPYIPPGTGRPGSLPGFRPVLNPEGLGSSWESGPHALGLSDRPPGPDRSIDGRGSRAAGI